MPHRELTIKCFYTFPLLSLSSVPVCPSLLSMNWVVYPLKDNNNAKYDYHRFSPHNMLSTHSSVTALNSKEDTGRAKSALNYWGRSSRLVTNHKPYLTTCQSNHLVPHPRSAKLPSFPRDKMTFPTLYFLSGILKSGQDTHWFAFIISSHQRECPDFFLVCTHAQNTCSHECSSVVVLPQCLEDDCRRSYLKSLLSVVYTQPCIHCSSHSYSGVNHL